METYKADQKSNPFIANLVDAISLCSDQFEAKVFAQLHAHTAKEREIFAKMDIDKLLAEKDKHKYITTSIYSDKLREIKQKHLERLPRVILPYIALSSIALLTLHPRRISRPITMDCLICSATSTSLKISEHSLQGNQQSNQAACLHKNTLPPPGSPSSKVRRSPLNP